MRTAHELILLFDPEWLRWLLYAYPTGAPLFEDLVVTCQRREAVQHVSFYNGDTGNVRQSPLKYASIEGASVRDKKQKKKET